MQASFRDPGGRVLHRDGRVFRIVDRDGADSLAAVLASPSARRFINRGALVSVRTVEGQDRDRLQADAEFASISDAIGAAGLFEHDRVPFPSFPYEWPPEMLHAAAELTLDLAEALLPEDLGLKDATPYNVLFRGAQPVFVDALSIERRDAHDPVWLPYAQFQRTFLLPLLAHQHLGWRASDVLLNRRDGLEPAEVVRFLPRIRRWFPPFLSLVTMPALLASGAPADGKIYQPKRLDNAEKARFVLGSTLRGLRRQLRRVAPVAARSPWSDYTGTRSHYSKADAEAKRNFVAAALNDGASKSVLDVGCNTGEFSVLAAGRGASVVAVDQDAAVVGQLFRRAQEERLDILPLAVDLARPTPPTGWRNRESPGFLDRARGHFDAVLMLAVLHHLVVNERVPLDDIFDLAADLTSSMLVIEFVARDDPMFRTIVRGRDALFEWYTRERFEQAALRRFDIVKQEKLPAAHRWMYRLEKKR